jgi:hypothetical protein
MKSSFAGVAAIAALLGGGLLGAGSASAGPASAQDEAAYLSWVQRFAASMGVTGTDAQLLSAGYATCQMRASGQSPEANGVSDLITTHAYNYLCPAWNSSR